MKNTILLMVVAMLCIGLSDATAQTSNLSQKSYGVWQGFGDVSDQDKFEDVNGGLSNVFWEDIEVAPDVWEWDSFDDDLTTRVKDSLPVILSVFTEDAAPDWLYQNGVPKVQMSDSKGNSVGYAPYYADPEYKFFFKRMITKVHQHIETMPAAVRKYIIGVQGCFGSTGDYIGYKGTVPQQYALSNTDFLNLFKEFSLHYYDEYKYTNPKIYLLSNPQNNGDEQLLWVIQNCPNSWIKTGSLGKGFQLNDERNKASWLYGILNTPQNGEYLRARSELQGDVSTFNNWWSGGLYSNMFAVMTYCIYWGMDWSNQGGPQLTDDGYHAAFEFYNKYAGYKDPTSSPYAMCALRDGLDASDAIRFPSSIYGTVNRNDTLRYRKIVNKFAAYGARLEDAKTATLNEQDNLDAKGINDVGWNIFSGNYDRYLHQLNANETSVGYWNVKASAEPNSIYGKYARGFNLSEGKNALYFDVNNLFLKNAPVDGAYPVSIEITYLDKGYGSFGLYYDASTGETDKASLEVTCGNSGKWKKASITLTDAYFGNRGTNSSDFYIKSTNTENVIFSIVELSRPQEDISGVGLFASSLAAFDTVCINTASSAQSFLLTGSFLNGDSIVVGPLKGYSFSKASSGTFTDSLVISGYGTAINQTIYVKLGSDTSENYNGNIPVYGGGAAPINVYASGTVVNSSPVLSVNLSNATCNNDKDGALDLNISGGTGPFTYKWTSSASSNFSSSNQDISSLIPANYTVVVTSQASCKATATYTVAQPAVLKVTVSVGSNIICKGGSTTIEVNASGGTMPYSGTGTRTVGSSNTTYLVTDANGCTARSARVNIANGTLTAPSKPSAINGDDADETGLCGGGNFDYSVNPVATATSYAWSLPAGSTIVSPNSLAQSITINVPANFSNGSIAVSAKNVCGSSPALVKTLYKTPAKPDGINGPVSVSKNQTGLKYQVKSVVPGITYVWNATDGARVTAGQNTTQATITWGTSRGKVTVRAQNDCGTSGLTSLDVSIGTSITAQDNTNTLATESIDDKLSAVVKLSPNPVKDMAYLTFYAETNARYMIELTDMNGKSLVRKEVTTVSGENRQQIDVHNYVNGMYFISITDNKGSRKTIKLVKN